MVWLETPINPTLNVVDIEKISGAVHSVANHVLVVVDNTFLTPVLQRPLDLGAGMTWADNNTSMTSVIKGTNIISNYMIFRRCSLFMHQVSLRSCRCDNGCGHNQQKWPLQKITRESNLSRSNSISLGLLSNGKLIFYTEWWRL